MSKKANPKLIGSFVLGAVALVIVGIIVFGSGRWFTEFERYVSYFRGSAQGLSVGSQVTFRGVPIGQVTQIDLLYDGKKLEFLTQVLFQIDPRSVREIDVAERDSDTLIDTLIKKGLRAQLVQQSFVTGQLAVQVDMFPSTKADLVGLDPDRTEIPTIPSTAEALESTIKRIAHKLDQLDLGKIIKDLQGTVSGIREIVASPQLKQTIANADQAMLEARQLISKFNNRVDPLAQSFEDTSKAARSALNEAERLLVDARPVLATTQNALSRAEKLMSTANTVIEPGSPLHFELVGALREVAGAARSLRSLADSLERNPKSLLFGRQAPGGR
jgi:paraquat-inducible protein B